MHLRVWVAPRVRGNMGCRIRTLTSRGRIRGNRGIGRRTQWRTDITLLGCGGIRRLSKLRGRTMVLGIRCSRIWIWIMITQISNRPLYLRQSGIEILSDLIQRPYSKFLALFNPVKSFGHRSFQLGNSSIQRIHTGHKSLFKGFLKSLEFSSKLINFDFSAECSRSP